LFVMVADARSGVRGAPITMTGSWRKRRHTHQRAVVEIGGKCRCWTRLEEHQQAVDRLREGGRAEEGGLGIMKEAAVEAPDG
jgi:hypothetical protein